MDLTINKKATTSAEIDDLIAKRWSPRAFDSERKISREAIISICEAARWAPSCRGDEPWRFVVFDKFSDRESYDKAFSLLDDWNRKWAKTPVLILACTDKLFRRGNPNDWGKFDVGAACENIYLQAFSLGLAAHPMAGFDADGIAREFEIPDRYEPVAMIAVGKRAEPDVLEEKYRKLELAERKRRPLGEQFFAGEWNKPIE